MTLTNKLLGLVMSDAVIMLHERMVAHPEEFHGGNGSWTRLLNKLNKDGFTKLEWWYLNRANKRISRKVTRELILKQIIAPEEPDKQPEVYMGQGTFAKQSLRPKFNPPTTDPTQKVFLWVKNHDQT